jgi:hypothetical protein
MVDLFYLISHNALAFRPLGISDADVDTEKPEPNNEKDETFLHFIKLSEIVGEVLRRLYSAKAKGMGYGRKEVENVTELLRGMLLDWRKCLPERLNISDSELTSLRAQFSSHLRPDRAYAEKGTLKNAYGLECIAYNDILLTPLISVLNTGFRPVYALLFCCSDFAESTFHCQWTKRKRQ